MTVSYVKQDTPTLEFVLVFDASVFFFRFFITEEGADYEDSIYTCTNQDTVHGHIIWIMVCFSVFEWNPEGILLFFII